MEATWRKVVNERQRAGLSFLWQETSRSLKILFAFFFISFVIYWILQFADSPIADLFKYAMALMFSFSVVLFLFQTSPRLRRYLPQSVVPQKARNGTEVVKHFLVILTVASLVLVLSLGADALIFLITAIMGTVGGIFLLMAAENSVHAFVIHLRRGHPELWKGTWTALAFMIVLLVVYIALEAVIAASNNQASATTIPPVPFIVLFGMLIAAQMAVISSFIVIRALAWIKRRRPNGVLKKAVSLETNPFSQFLYLEGIQHAYMLFAYLYILLIIYQALALASENGGVPSLGWGLISSGAPSDLLQILIFGSFAISWMMMSFNIIGAAVDGRVPLLNKHNIIPISLLVLMVLLMHTTVVQANEIVFSLILRTSYLLGLAIGPLVALIVRLRKIKGECSPD